MRARASGWSQKHLARDERPMQDRVGTDQYRTTTMIAMTMMAAISESARSNVSSASLRRALRAEA